MVLKNGPPNDWSSQWELDLKVLEAEGGRATVPCMRDVTSGVASGELFPPLQLKLGNNWQQNLDVLLPLPTGFTKRWRRGVSLAVHRKKMKK